MFLKKLRRKIIKMNFKFQKKSLNTIKKFKNLKIKILKELKIILIKNIILEKLMTVFFLKKKFNFFICYICLVII
jgi:hypothetical protein